MPSSYVRARRNVNPDDPKNAPKSAKDGSATSYVLKVKTLNKLRLVGYLDDGSTDWIGKSVPHTPLVTHVQHIHQLTIIHGLIMLSSLLLCSLIPWFAGPVIPWFALHF